MTKLNVGDPAPEFEATDTQGESLRLSALIAGGPLILAFFPKAATPG